MSRSTENFVQYVYLCSYAYSLHFKSPVHVVLMIGFFVTSLAADFYSVSFNSNVHLHMESTWVKPSVNYRKENIRSLLNHQNTHSYITLAEHKIVSECLFQHLFVSIWLSNNHLTGWVICFLMFCYQYKMYCWY